MRVHITGLPPGSGRTRGRSRWLVPMAAGALAVSMLPGGAAAAPAGASTATAGTHRLPYQDARLPVRVRVNDLLARMTLVEKIGQMTQAERGAVTGDPSLVATWHLGAVLSGGGSTPTPNTPEAWADMVDGFQAQALTTRLHIPLLYGVDTVHGHGNLVGATIFPHNINLGATRDPALVQRVEHVAAAETRATGPQWAFGPCVCVARDTRWGRTYESFGESPALAAVLGAAAIEGFQGPRGSQLSRSDRVLASAKHYAGDGDTTYGTSVGDFKIDQGITITNRADFDRLALTPYRAAVRAGVGTAMPSYSSVDWTEDGLGNPIKMHANQDLITGVLKGQMDFGGFVISDWEGIHQLPGDWPAQVRTGVNAGTDMFMEPFSYQSFETTLLDEVGAGRVSQARVDDAVRRILTRKFELGLFEHPFTDRSGLRSVGSAAHRGVAREAVAESQVLLKNSRNALPLRGTEKVYVAGSNADNIGNQAGGWTVQWQGMSGATVPGTTVLQGIRQVAPRARVTFSPDGTAPTAGSDVGIVVVGETPYSEGFGDVGGPQWSDNGVPRGPKSLELNAADRATIDRVCGAIAKCVVLVVAGRPQVLTGQLGAIDALVFAGLPGTEGAGVADVLFGRRPFTGRLSQTWPRSADQEPINVGDARYRPLYPYGWGLRTDSGRSRLAGLGISAAGWNADGSVRSAAAVLPGLTAASAALTRAHAPLATAEAVVSVVRDLAQARMAAGAAGIPADAAALSASADEQLLDGRPDLAVRLLVRAGGLG
jgi:beta-glucosidase